MAKPQGEMRQSQVVTTFGPGSMVDLPDYSVLIGGLDFWSGSQPVSEPRLSQKLGRALGMGAVELRTPPPASDDPTAPQTGIAGFRFPEWFVTQDTEQEDRPGVRSRVLVHRDALRKGEYEDDNRKRWKVVPIRFVRACRAGHIGDVDWWALVHGGQTDCRTNPARRLYMDERGTTGDLGESTVRCDCGAEISLAVVAMRDSRRLGACDGARPWLGPYTGEKCGEIARLLVRSASNAYFPQIMSVISLPDRGEAVRRAIDAVWPYLEQAETVEDVRYEKRKTAVREVLEQFSDDEVVAELQARRSGTVAAEKKVKVAELETLVSVPDETGDDRPQDVFYARGLPRNEWDAPWMAPVQRVVLVHRLREVVAQAGFTRFEAASPDTEGELDMGVRRAALAREAQWLPAYENKGEGVFLQFRPDALQEWLERDAVQQRALSLARGFDAWRKDHPGSQRKLPSLQFLMLHSFSHLLLTAVSLGCGYPASSIRERIYAVPGLGYGVLLYTGTSDAEGTLGGLVQVGRRIRDYVRSALELGRLCSNDPVCGQHNPANALERRFLHGAACHGCLLIAETSCEQQNDFLDRALVVQTVAADRAEFFVDPESASGATA